MIFHGTDNMNKGFTFIELILYVTLIMLVFGSLTSVGIITAQAGQKSSVVQEVGATGRYISERIKKEIREARGINSVASTSISLQTFDLTKDPTVIDLSAGNVRIKQGAGSAIAINPTNATITGLTFTNQTSANQKTKNIRFLFAVQSATTSASQLYINSMTVQGDAEVRSN